MDDVDFEKTCEEKCDTECDVCCVVIPESIGPLVKLQILN